MMDSIESAIMRLAIDLSAIGSDTAFGHFLDFALMPRFTPATKITLEMLQISISACFIMLVQHLDFKP